MRAAELAQPTGTECRQSQSHDALVVGISDARDEVRGLGSVDQADRTVVTEQQRVGHLADRRVVRARVAADGEQELVLRRRHAERRGLLLAPVQETAKLGAEPEQTLVFVVAQVTHAGIS